MLSKTFVYVHPKDRTLPVLYSNDKTTHRNITRHHRTERKFCLKTENCIQTVTEWKEGEEDE